MKTILVSLISDQTIPNLEFIKERDDIDQYLFISTESMEKKGVLNWIIKASGINENVILPTIKVNAFSMKNIEDELDLKIKEENKYIVNITGGTKIMTIGVFDFFIKLNSEIFYVTGNGKYIKIHPGRLKPEYEMKSSIDLEEYLLAYGFTIKNRSTPCKDFDYCRHFLNYFLNSISSTDRDIIEFLRENHRGTKNLKIEKVNGLSEFLSRIDFPFSKPNKLTKYETKFLTGEWLEDYLYLFLVNKDFNIPESNISVGIHIDKNDSTNELDVFLMKNNKLYAFECKTSVTYLKDGKEMNFLNETVYKSTTLKNNFGLFAKSIIVTLDDLNSPKFKSAVERAELNKIQLIDINDFKSEETLYAKLKSI